MDFAILSFSKPFSNLIKLNFVFEENSTQNSEKVSNLQLHVLDFGGQLLFDLFEVGAARVQALDRVLSLGQPRLQFHLGVLQVVDLGNRLGLVPEY